MLQSDNDAIQEKLLDRVADLDAARLRWVVAVIFTAFLFFVVLGVFLAPVSELSTTQTDQFKVPRNTNTETGIETIAIPSWYFIHFEFDLNPNYMDTYKGANAYIFIFKDKIPPRGSGFGAEYGDDISYLKAKSFRNATINGAHPEIIWDLAFRDCDTNNYYVMIMRYPDDPDSTNDDPDLIIDMEVKYEPLLPLIPIFFVLAFIIVLPIAIIRLYVVAQKKKELRVLLTLDFESLSDEDKLRLGIPITPKPQTPQPIPSKQPMSPPPQRPGQMG